MSIQRRSRVHSGGRAIGYVEYSEEPLPAPLPAKLVAFYVPQFHTIAENDEWLGKGFTDWSNVARALPQFEGHLQPRLPGDLGFYDLRNPQVMRDQAKLAKTYGLSAFCFYFYWFASKTLLEEPLRNWLADKSIDFEYCLCWANEDWARRWDDREDEVLIAQRHSAEDDIAFIRHVSQYLRDPRYLRVNGKPLLLLHRPGLLPNASATAARWRAWCRDHEIGEIQLAYVQSFEQPDPADIGFDAAVECPPYLATGKNLTAKQVMLNARYQGQVLDWRDMARSHIRRELPGYALYRGVNCGWDSEARRPGTGQTWLHASPAMYSDWVRAAIRSSAMPEAPVFINAWNGWADGAVLEPDTFTGYAWLASTRRAHRPSAAKRRGGPCVVIHAWYPDVLAELLVTLQDRSGSTRLIVTTAIEREEEVRAVLGANAPDAELCVFGNRGRDIRPFLEVATRLADQGEDIVLKLHTKRSPHRSDGDLWRQHMVQALANPDAAASIQRAFIDDPCLGMVVPAGHLLPFDSTTDANAHQVASIATSVGLDYARSNAMRFAAGSMFWVRLQAIVPLLDRRIPDELFEPEAAQLDGTAAHAIERLFVSAAESGGYRVQVTEPHPPSTD